MTTPTQPVITPMFSPSFAARLREMAQTHYSYDAVQDELGPQGQAALARADLAGVELLSRSGTPTATLIRLFLLGLAVTPSAATAALAPASLDEALQQGLLTAENAGIRAALDLRPYAEESGPDWWVLSDVGSQLRPGPVQTEHVLGIGAAGTTLAQAVIRDPVGRALDVGTGCGLQSLHLSRHCGSVVATDISSRALAIAATNALLNGLEWDLRQGSLTEPARSETFDLIVCNPPFVVGPGFAPGRGGYDYRDSGLSGDAVSETLIRTLPALLSEGGTAQLLANWAVTAAQPWQERIGSWLDGAGCDAWIWQRELVEPGEYVSQWLRDSGEELMTARWGERYRSWMQWFQRSGVLAVGMGLVSLRRADSSSVTVVAEDVRQAVAQPVGATIQRWLRHCRWLREHDDRQLLASVLHAAPDLVLSVQSVIAESGWEPALIEVRQGSGARWELEVDDAVGALIAGCRGQLQVGFLLDLLSAASADALPNTALETVRYLIQRDVLSPFPD